MTDLEKAFIKFKERYRAAVQTDTLLMQSDDDWRLEKKARLFWQEANDAEREFKQMLAEQTPPLIKLLQEARQYVSDAGSDEDHETRTHSSALLDEIDAAIRARQTT